MPVRDLLELLRRQGEALGPNSWNGTSQAEAARFGAVRANRENHGIDAQGAETQRAPMCRPCRHPNTRNFFFSREYSRSRGACRGPRYGASILLGGASQGFRPGLSYAAPGGAFAAGGNGSKARTGRSVCATCAAWKAALRKSPRAADFVKRRKLDFVDAAKVIL